MSAVFTTEVLMSAFPIHDPQAWIATGLTGLAILLLARSLRGPRKSGCGPCGSSKPEKNAPLPKPR